MKKNESKWISIEDYAKIVGQSIRTIQRYIRQGEVKSKKEGKKTLIYTDDEVGDETFPEIIKLKSEKLEEEIRYLRIKNEERALEIYEHQSLLFREMVLELCKKIPAIWRHIRPTSEENDLLKKEFAEIEKKLELKLEALKNRCIKI